MEITEVDSTPDGTVVTIAERVSEDASGEAADVAAPEVAEVAGTAPRARSRAVTVPDPACAAAVELARAAAVDEAGDAALVGEHLGVEAEGERVVLHRFVCLDRAYPYWTWAVAVTRAPRLRRVTVDDVVLLPADGASVAPPWVPWSERLRPGDMGVGDLLPTAADDPRLVLRRADVDDFADTGLWYELGLGRARVLSFEGREEAAERWWTGEPGPTADIARAAPAHCLTCGFHVRLVGALGQAFGVCTNEFAPDDGSVTAFEHGCGAHSEALVLPSAHPEPVLLDDASIELVGTAAHPPGSVPDGEAPEPYGHS